MTLALSHEVLGVVTNAIGTLSCANPITKENIILKSPDGLQTNLCQVLQPATVLGTFKWAAIPKKGATNSGKGLLNWNDRFVEVVAPSVHAKGRWVGIKKDDCG